MEQYENSNNLIEKYTFDNFVVGKSNKFAYDVALEVSAHPGRKYNPLYMCGDSGFGKTHLAVAIGNRIKNENSDKNVLYVTGEKFVSEILDIIRSGGSSFSFSEKYKSADVLIIDDIQFIIGKKTSQNELYHILNALHIADKQIILTSSDSPNYFRNNSDGLEKIEEELILFFGWGVIAEIQSPDTELKIEIIKRRLEEAEVELPQDIIEYVALNVTDNIAVMEGAIKTLLVHHKLEQETITLDKAKELIFNYISF